MKHESDHDRMGGCTARQRAGGFTFVETMLALAISGLVGLGVALMLGALSVGTNAQNDARQASVKRQVAALRLGAATRGGARVLASADDHLVLWLGDIAGTGEVNLSELRRIGWDADAGAVYVYEAPAGIAPDLGYAFDSKFSLVTGEIAGTMTFPGRLVLRDVIEWEAQPDAAGAHDPPRLLRMRVTVDDEGGAVSVSVVAALRGTDDSDGGGL